MASVRYIATLLYHVNAAEVSMLAAAGLAVGAAVAVPLGPCFIR